jgi:hypothetical protein
MLLEKYEQEGLLFNTNFNEHTSEPGKVAYRGELVLVEGEVADSQGRRKPPVSVMRHAVLLSDHNKLAMVVGSLDHLSQMQSFIDKYKGDFAEGMKAVFFVVDLKDALQLDVEGEHFVLIPLTEGVAWNEMVDELALEKSDFKGQSAGDKVLTLFGEMADYAPKYPTVASMEEALSYTADIKREGKGAV